MTIRDVTLDNGLVAMTSQADTVFLCPADPTTWANADSTAVAKKTGSRGSMFYAISSPVGGGRMASLASFSDGSVTSNGNANYIAIGDSTTQTLFLTEQLAQPQTLQSGGVFGVTSLQLILGATTQPVALNFTVSSPSIDTPVFAKKPPVAADLTVTAPVFGLPILVAVLSGWTNIPIATLTGGFSCAFDATPAALAVNDLVGLSNGPANAYAQMACIVRFNATNTIDARNGANYGADASVSYVASTAYHIQITGDINAHTYSVWVTPQGQGTTQIAANYAFRTEQAAVTQLNNIAINVTDVGGLAVSNITFNSLAANALTTGSPVLPAPILNGQVALIASSLTTASAVIPSIDMKQRHKITATNLVDSSPTWAAPSLLPNTGVAPGAFNNQTGTFTIQWDGTPTTDAASGENVAQGLSNGPVGGVTGMACIVRFYTDGNITVRNGSTYGADATVPYSVGMSFHFTMIVNIPNHIYTVLVTPQGQSQITLATNYAFRTEQVSITDLNYLGQFVTAGSATMANMIAPPVQALPPVVTDATFSLTTSGPAWLAGDVVGTVTATNSPTSWAITAGNALGYYAISNGGVVTVTAAGIPTSALGGKTGTSSLTVQATNANGSGTGTVTINYSPALAVPVITSAGFTVAHNPAASTLVGQLVATNSPDYFTITSGNEARNFVIDRSGNIRTTNIFNGDQLTRAMVGRAGAAAQNLPLYSSTLTTIATNPLTISADATYRNVNFTGEVDIIGGKVLFEYCRFSFQPTLNNGGGHTVYQYNNGAAVGQSQFNYCDWDSGFTNAGGVYESDGYSCGTRAPGAPYNSGTNSSFNFYRCDFAHYGNMLALHIWQHNPRSYVTECYLHDSSTGGTYGSVSTHVDFIETYSSDTITIQRNNFDNSGNRGTSLYTCGGHFQAAGGDMNMAPSNSLQFLNNFCNLQGGSGAVRINAESNGLANNFKSVFYIGNHYNDVSSYNAVIDLSSVSGSAIPSYSVTHDLAYALANPTVVYFAKSNVWAANVESPSVGLAGGNYDGGQVHTPGGFVDRPNWYGGTHGWNGSILGPTTGDPVAVAVDDAAYSLTVTATNALGTSTPVQVNINVGQPGTAVGPFNDRTTDFTIQWDVVPTNSLEDALCGLSDGAPSAPSDFACIVRFYTAGSIDAYNGTGYGSSATLPYSAGTQYHIRMVVRMSNDTYDVYVTPQGQTEVLLANNFAFRSSLVHLNYLGTYVTSGGLTLSNMIGPPVETLPPVVTSASFSLTTSGAGWVAGDVVGTMVATMSPTSWAITVGNGSGYYAISNSGVITVTAAGIATSGLGGKTGTSILTCQATNAYGSGTGTATINYVAGGAGITHGSQLTSAMTGPAGLGYANFPAALPSNFRKGTDIVPGTTYWSDASLEALVPAGNYVYNNSPNNYGGIVPAGGMMIDGYQVEAGCRVIQFCDFSGATSIRAPAASSTAGVMLRGCRFRGSTGEVYKEMILTAASNYTGVFRIHYCDLGSTSYGGPNLMRNVAIATNSMGGLVCLRNYISNTGSGIHPIGMHPDGLLLDIAENWICNLTPFNTSPGYHLDGIMFIGGNANVRIIRNHIVIPAQDDFGNPTTQTCCGWTFAQQNGPSGYGTNPAAGGRPAEVGMIVDSNYVGGTGWCFYAGDSYQPMQNQKYTNNLFTTTIQPNGGYYGPLVIEGTAGSGWGVNGSVATNNRWADGPKAGTLAFGS